MTQQLRPGSVLVTGGSGFIGVPLCQRLRQSGWEVCVLSRSLERAKKRLGPGIRVVKVLEGDRPYDALVNLAGEPLAEGRWTEKRKAVFRESRIDLTGRLVEHFRRVGKAPAVVVSGSAIGYYGDRGDERLTEDSGPGAGFGADLCRAWEAAAEAFSAQGSRVCCIRTGIVLESDGGALKSLLVPFRLGLGGRLGRGDHWMPWIHREDLLALIQTCLENPTWSGAVNGTAPAPVTNRAFTQALARVVRRPALIPVPAFALRMMMGEMADELLLASQRVLPKAALERGFDFTYPDLSHALGAILTPKAKK